jgi:hypothetical protein
LGFEPGLNKGCLCDACKLQQQEHKIQNNDIINKMNKEPCCTVVNQVAEDVAQPLNHCHACRCKIGEIKEWKEKSDPPRCPACGNCSHCMKSEPLVNPVMTARNGDANQVM